MSIEISIWTILKLSVAVLGTYFVLPLVLVGRDKLLWWVIDKYLLTEELRDKIWNYANNTERWNREIVGVGGSSISSKQEEDIKYKIGKNQVPREVWLDYDKKRNKLASNMQDELWFIQKRNNLIKWLLKHYKQDEESPIDRWVKKEAEKAARKHEERYAFSQRFDYLKNAILNIGVINDLPVELGKLRTFLIETGLSESPTIKEFFSKWLTNPMVVKGIAALNVYSREATKELQHELNALQL